MEEDKIKIQMDNGCTEISIPAEIKLGILMETLETLKDIQVLVEKRIERLTKID